MHITVDNDTITASQLTLFTKIRDRILTAPVEQFDMDDWFTEPTDDTETDDIEALDAARRQLHEWIYQTPSKSGLVALSQHGDEMLSFCGTAACLAGWAVVAGVDPHRTPKDTDYPHLYERNIAVQLGMHVRLEAYEQDIHDVCSWFSETRWPTWTDRYRRPHPDHWSEAWHRDRQADSRAIVLAVLTEFVDGMRTDWWHEPTDDRTFYELVQELRS